MTIEIKCEGSEWLITARGGPDEARLIRTMIPFARRDDARRCWVSPRGQWWQLESLRECANVTFVEEDGRRLDDIPRPATPPLDETPLNDTFRSLGGATPRPFQWAGIRWLVERTRRGESSLLCDDTGLGKTVMVLGALHALGTQRALILGPANAQPVWREHIAKWAPEHVENWKIISYDSLVARARGGGIHTFMQPWEVIVCDEMHRLKNGEAQRTSLVKDMVAQIKCPVIGTSATPTPNGGPIELVEPLEILNVMPHFGGKWTFLGRYTRVIRDRGGYVRYIPIIDLLPELHTRLRGVCLLRRTKPEVGVQLPPLTRTWVPLDLRVDTKPMQLPAELDALEGYETREEVKSARQALGAAKVAGVIDWMEDALEGGQRKLVVFGWHNVFLDGILAAFPGAVGVRGGMDEDARALAVKRFQEDPEVRVFAGQMKAGSDAITLTAASDVLFGELWYVPGDHEQAEGRCHRMGQTVPVTAWYFWAPDTIDVQIRRTLQKKRESMTVIHDGTSALLREFSAPGRSGI